MIHSVDVSLLRQPPQPLTSVKGKDDAWAQQLGLPLTETVHSHCWVPSLPAPETNTEVLIWHYPLGWSASYLVTDWLFWTTFIKEWAVFCSYSNNTYSGCRFAFSALNASAKTAICGLTECLNHQQGIPLWLETHFTAVKWDSWPRVMEFIGFSIFPIIQKELAW